MEVGYDRDVNIGGGLGWGGKYWSWAGIWREILEVGLDKDGNIGGGLG